MKNSKARTTAPGAGSSSRLYRIQDPGPKRFWMLDCRICWMSESALGLQRSWSHIPRLTPRSTTSCNPKSKT